MTPPALNTSAPRLHLVQAGDPSVARRWFCSHCADVHRAVEPPLRVCRKCGLGLLLCTRADAVPGRRDPFIVVDSSLTVQAMSERAEEVLGVREEQAVNRHVTEILIPGEPGRPSANLAVAIARAAAGAESQDEVVVRPASTFGIRLRARVAACGPPPAALVVLS